MYVIVPYLVNRMVKFNGKNSDLLLVPNGVPQGFVLGSFLFIIYVNELPHFLQTRCVLYADDRVFDWVVQILRKLHIKNENFRQI